MSRACLVLTLCVGVSTTALAQTTLDVVPAQPYQYRFGQATLGVGDVDADGFDDFAVGAPNAYVYFNGSVTLLSGRDRSVLWTIAGASRDHFGTSLALGDDVDGDGVADVAIGAIQHKSDLTNAYGYVRLVSGATGATLWTRKGAGVVEYLGISLAAVGDLDHDGVGDFVAGTNLKMARVISGATGALLGSLTGGYTFGTSVSAAGDANADGTPDFLIATPAYGMVNLFSGATLQILRTWNATVANEGLGTGMADVGDWNGDGVDDHAIGSPGFDVGALDGGAVHVYSGATGALLRAFHGTVDAGRLGTRVDGAGDVDLDGHLDVVASAPGSPIVPSSVRVFSGATGLEVCAFLAPATPNQSFGVGLAHVGDVDGDDLPDFVIGSPYEAPFGVAYVVSSALLGAQPYGAGTPGCDGAHAVTANVVPRVGEAAFELRCDEVVPPAVGALVLGAQQDVLGTTIGGVTFHVGLGAPYLLLPTSATTEHAAFALPLPALPSLAGLQAYAQFVWQSASVCAADPTGLSSSRGLALTIQP